MGKISAQEFADKVLGDKFRQPLKSIEEACAANGWPFVDNPECCGEPIEVKSMIGSPYFARCAKCRKFIADACGPSFGNSWVQFVDTDKVDISDGKTWIAGTEPTEGE